MTNVKHTNNQIVVSGIRPTGYLHLGNYVGAIQNFVKMQNEYTCFFFVADWHSLTTHPDTKSLQENTYRVLAEHIASGIDIDKSTLFVQSQVPEIAELFTILTTLAYKGELEKTVTFKEKIKLQADNINAGLLTYPILQAADILIHQATKVPVGKDQAQHLEMARNFAQRFNHRYGNIFPEPQAFSYAKSGLQKILSLDGTGKMSKSENQLSTIYLADPDDLIHKKIMRALTDEGPSKPGSTPPPYIENLFTLLDLGGNQDRATYYREQYKKCDIRYGDLKKELATVMVDFIAPIREKTNHLLQDKDMLNHIIHKGTTQARESAQITIQQVRKAMHTTY